MKKIMIFNDRAITVYDTVNKCPIAVFSTPTLAARYLWPNRKSCATKISEATKRKLKMHDTMFDFPVCARYSNEAQADVLSGKEYHIFEGYATPPISQMKGFTDTRLSLYASAIKKNN